MKQYILLDWDGNLAKTLDIWLEAIRVAAEKRNIFRTDEEIAQSFGAPMNIFASWGVTDPLQMIDEMDRHAARLMSDVELYPDALEVLEELKKRGKQTALITTSLRRNVIHLLDKYDLHKNFDVIIANEDTEKHKPNPEPLEKALKQLGGTKDQAIMIGDSDKDMGAALNAGVDSILFYPPEHTKFYNLKKLQSLKPTHIVKDFRNILAIV